MSKRTELIQTIADMIDDWPIVHPGGFSAIADPAALAEGILDIVEAEL